MCVAVSSDTFVWTFPQSAATGASRDAPDGPEGSGSSGSEEDLPAAGTSSQVDPGAADGLSAPDLTGSGSGSVGLECGDGADEPRQVCDPRLNLKYVLVLLQLHLWEEFHLCGDFPALGAAGSSEPLLPSPSAHLKLISS